MKIRTLYSLEKLELFQGCVESSFVNQFAGAENLSEIPLGADERLQDIVEGVQADEGHIDGLGGVGTEHR